MDSSNVVIFKHLDVKYCHFDWLTLRHSSVMGQLLNELSNVRKLGKYSCSRMARAFSGPWKFVLDIISPIN